ncbi:hypothetical protein HOLleu_15705 [Holothuria leucospilota]|uniref:Uncharacterized protein n=1 Tax=Holothuria leucospilota TaxID=206669 RepID=A0A9Q1C4N9_HOLLE|nr:hypothetical protein HOLleu_15705 [Holothuria leucospilota]
MVKTSTKERSQRHRAKGWENEELHTLVKDKYRKRNAAQRRAAKQKMTEADIVKQRKYERERKKIQRQQRQKMQGEVHRLFVAETDIDISRSKFCELRPQHTVPMSAVDQDVCLCRYHENINMMVTSLNKVPLFPASADDVLNATVCSMENEECVNRQCPTCDTDNLDELFATADVILVTFYQWTYVDDTLNHDKSAVVSFNHAILYDVQHKLPFKISQVHYWSDGAGSQFRNKKGPIDDTGGEVKRCVWRAVLQDRIVVNTAEDFYSAAKDLCRKITLPYLRPSGKPGHIEHGRNSPFRAGEGDLQLARVQSVNGNDSQAGGQRRNAFYRTTTKPQPGETARAILPAVQPTLETYYHGDFLQVGLSTGRSRKVFLGQVVALDNANQGELHISFLRAADTDKQLFVFPHREDTSWIFRSEVVRKMPLPNVNNRGHSKFPEPLPVLE